MTSDAETSQRRRWYHGWNIIAACMLAQVAASGIPALSYSLFLPSWTHDLHTTISVLQLPWMPFALMCAIVSPTVGTFADKLPARWMFAFGLSGMTLFSVAVSLVTDAWQLVSLYALLLPFALQTSTSITANALVSRWFVRRIGLALGLTAIGVALGGVILPPIVAALLPVIGWRAIWRYTALLIGLVALPLVVITVRNRPAVQDGRHYLDVDPSEAHHAPSAPGGGGTLKAAQILRRRNFWLILGIFLPILAAYVGVLQNLVLIAISRGFGHQTAGALLSVMSVAQIIAALALGMLSDRFGNRLPFAAVAAMTACGVAAIAFGHSVALLIFGAALVGCGGGSWPLVGASIAAEFGAASFGRAFGLLASFIQLFALAPFIIAKTQEITGTYVPALLGLGALVAIGGCSFLTIDERRPSPFASTEVPA